MVENGDYCLRRSGSGNVRGRMGAPIRHGLRCFYRRGGGAATAESVSDKLDFIPLYFRSPQTRKIPVPWQSGPVCLSGNSPFIARGESRRLGLPRTREMGVGAGSPAKEEGAKVRLKRNNGSWDGETSNLSRPLSRR